MAAIAPPAPALPRMTLTRALSVMEKAAFMESLMALMFNQDSLNDQRSNQRCKTVRMAYHVFEKIADIHIELYITLTFILTPTPA